MMNPYSILFNNNRYYNGLKYENPNSEEFINNIFEWKKLSYLF